MSDLSKRDFKQIAHWHGYQLIIEKKYDASHKKYDFVWISWKGAKYLYELDWFYNLQFKCRTMKEVVSLLEAKRKEIETDQ